MLRHDVPDRQAAIVDGASTATCVAPGCGLVVQAPEPDPVVLSRLMRMHVEWALRIEVTDDCAARARGFIARFGRRPSLRAPQRVERALARDVLRAVPHLADAEALDATAPRFWAEQAALFVSAHGRSPRASSSSMFERRLAVRLGELSRESLSVEDAATLARFLPSWSPLGPSAAAA